MHFRKTLIAVLLFFLFSGALINLNADKKKKPVKKAVDILTGVPLIKATSNVVESY